MELFEYNIDSIKVYISSRVYDLFNEIKYYSFSSPVFYTNILYDIKQNGFWESIDSNGHEHTIFREVI